MLKGSVKLAKNSIGNITETSKLLADNLLRIENYTSRIEQYIETMSSIQKLEEINVQRELTKWDSLICELKNIIGFHNV